MCRCTRALTIRRHCPLSFLSISRTSFAVAHLRGRTGRDVPSSGPSQRRWALFSAERVLWFTAWAAAAELEQSSAVFFGNLATSRTRCSTFWTASTDYEADQGGRSLHGRASWFELGSPMFYPYKAPVAKGRKLLSYLNLSCDFSSRTKVKPPFQGIHGEVKRIGVT